MYTLWSGTFDRELRDVLALQSDVARASARQIEIALGRKQRPVDRARVAPGGFMRVT